VQLEVHNHPFFISERAVPTNENKALGMYLKLVMNVFVGRSVNLWHVTGQKSVLAGVASIWFFVRAWEHP
jgi:hypothetical protein